MSDSITENIKKVKDTLAENVTLVAVSKTKPNKDIEEAYHAGQRVFGENKAQELAQKFEDLPKDIEWHMIGHLQSNKVKYIAPFIHLIHAVHKEKLLREINKQARKNNRSISCLIQIHVAEEETKFGFTLEEAKAFLLDDGFEDKYSNVKIEGIMAMATNTSEEDRVRSDFQSVNLLFQTLKKSSLPSNVTMKTLSMGMSGDYKIAIDCGSNMVRVGSTIFGHRS